MTAVRLRGAVPRVAFPLTAILALPWIWLSLQRATRAGAIAWLSLTAAMGVLLGVAGLHLVAVGTTRHARWGGLASLVVGAGLVGLAIAMLPIARASTWAV